MGKIFVFCLIKLNFCSWLYKKRWTWHTSWKFQLEITSNKKVITKIPLTNLYEMNSRFDVWPVCVSEREHVWEWLCVCVCVCVCCFMDSVYFCVVFPVSCFNCIVSSYFYTLIHNLTCICSEFNLYFII